MRAAIKQSRKGGGDRQQEEEGTKSDKEGSSIPGRSPEVLVSFCHHIPGLEEKDLNFFRLAKDKFGFEVEQLPTVSKNHIFGAKTKIVSVYLYRMWLPE